MAKEEKLKKKVDKDDPEMIRHLELLRNMDLYQMIKELNMLKPKEGAQKKNGESSNGH